MFALPINIIFQFIGDKNTPLEQKSTRILKHPFERDSVFYTFTTHAKRLCLSPFQNTMYKLNAQQRSRLISDWNAYCCCWVCVCMCVCECEPIVEINRFHHFQKVYRKFAKSVFFSRIHSHWFILSLKCYWLFFYALIVSAHIGSRLYHHRNIHISKLVHAKSNKRDWC